MKYVFILLSLIYSLSVSSQSEINEEVAVRTVMDKFERLGKAQPEINGWRIKIINTTDRRKMEQANYKFQQYYPNRKSVTSYENPYYSIRTGAFQTRIELEPFLVELKEHFRGVIPVRDKISKDEIVAAIINGK